MRVVINGQEYTNAPRHFQIKPDSVGEYKPLNGVFYLKNDTTLEGEPLEVISPRHSCVFSFTYVENVSGG